MRTTKTLALLLIFPSASCLAYIGPGSGISLLGGIWGVLLAVLLALLAILVWPIRFVLRRMRRGRHIGEAEPSGATKEEEEPTGPTNRAE